MTRDLTHLVQLEETKRERGTHHNEGLHLDSCPQGRMVSIFHFQILRLATAASAAKNYNNYLTQYMPPVLVSLCIEIKPHGLALWYCFGRAWIGAVETSPPSALPSKAPCLRLLYTVWQAWAVLLRASKVQVVHAPLHTASPALCSISPRCSRI